MLPRPLVLLSQTDQGVNFIRKTVSQQHNVVLWEEQKSQLLLMFFIMEEVGC